MKTSVLRQAVRCRQTLPSRRWASDSASSATSSAVSTAQGAAQKVQSQAARGLSRVSDSADSAATGARNSAGRAVNYAQGIVPPFVYYSKVCFELSRLVARGRQMYPPDASTFQKVYEPFINAFRNPAATFHRLNTPANSPQNLLNRMASINSAQVTSAAVLLAEVLGFFTVGEMLGRMKFIGYHGHVEHHE